MVASFSCEMLPTWEIVFSWIPKNVIVVVGAVRFSALVLMPSWSHRVSIPKMYKPMTVVDPR